MPRPVNRLPFNLSGRGAAVSAALLKTKGQEIDVAIANVPFRLATTQDFPQTIETIPIRKDQLDTEADPGEQSLSGWWRRSQDSWHEGAGHRYQESRSEVRAGSGFWDSRGIDVWDENEMKLLRRMEVKTAYGTGYSRLVVGSTISAVKGGALYTTAAVDTALASLHAPAGETIVDGFVTGAYFYDISDDTLYEGTTASPGTATSWPLTGGGATRLAFGKHRPWVIGGRRIWQPNLSLAASTAQDPIFVNPNQGFTYTCLAEGPASMLFGGHDGRTSSVQTITLSADGGVPTLSGATVALTLPDGELLQEIAVLAGQYIGLGTNKGFRVGVIEGDNIFYGPLLIEPEDVTACKALTTDSRYFLVAFQVTGGRAECYRVDTGIEIGDGIFPYARDIEVAATGYITSLAVSGNRVLALDDTGQFAAQHTTELVNSGYLTTGRIRFRTTEKKLFKYLEMDLDALAGTLAISAITDTDTSLDVASFGSQGQEYEGAFEIPSVLGPQRFMSLTFTFTRSGTDATQGPVLHSYLVKALPSVRPQRLITLPVLCFDQETAKSGQRYGFEGFAEERFNALKAIEDIGDTVIYQDFTEKSPTGQIVTIENMRFVQTSPGRVAPGSSGHGGVLFLQLRTVSA